MYPEPRNQRPASEERYRTLFENAPVAIWEEDFSQIKLLLEEWERQGVADLHGYLSQHPEFTMECVRRLQVLDVNKRAVEFYDAPGKAELIAATPRLFDDAALKIFRDEIVAFASGQAEFVAEVPTRTLTGAERIVEMKVMLLPTPADDWSQAIVSFVDVTERKRLAERSLEAQKLESIGRLAGGVAHEFNNLLTVINGYSDLLLARPSLAGDVRANIQHIRDAGEDAAVLVRQLLAFSRKQALKPSMLDVSQVIRDIEAALRSAVGDDIETVFELASGLPPVKADPAQIQHVVFSLAANARDAMPRGGRLTIQTERAVVAESELKQLTAVHPGLHVLITVADNGTGMDDDTARHLFEPFYTTKDPGKGTGMGLASVFGIVRQSGGDIAVTTRVGEGSSFRVYLPAAQSEAS
jgi:signal transduction histidine kinase